MEITLLDGGTSSTTGGSAQVMSESGKKLNQGKVLVDTSVTDFFSRPELQLVSRMPTEQPDGTWSKKKTSVRYVVPFTTDAGDIVYNLVRVETEVHPDAAASVEADLREKGAQIAIDSELDDFYATGSLA
jgi:hypothetical protein